MSGITHETGETLGTKGVSVTDTVQMCLTAGFTGTGKMDQPELDPRTRSGGREPAPEHISLPHVLWRVSQKKIRTHSLLLLSCTLVQLFKGAVSARAPTMQRSTARHPEVTPFPVTGDHTLNRTNPGELQEQQAEAMPPAHARAAHLPCCHPGEAGWWTPTDTPLLSP